MKNIAEHCSPQNRLSMHRWFWHSAFLLGALCAGIVLTTLQQYASYHDVLSENAQLKSGTAGLHACLARKRELKESVEQLSVRLTKYNNIKYRPKNPAILLRALDAMPSDVQPDDIVLKKKNIDLVIHGQSIENIVAYVDRLKGQECCANVAIISLEQTGDRIKAALHVVLR